jgi:hypothetical protein
MPAQPTLQILDRGAFRVKLEPAACSLDLGDGSERGEYVSQDYIFRALGRPHRSINLMYCYYPYDKGWPQRASVAFPPSRPFAWAYPYDDYFPYGGGRKGNTRGEPFQQMRDIRRHGQDVTLTLAIDCAVRSSELERLAEELAPFARMRLRINHECDGDWFAFNKRYKHEVIAAFFIRFAKILKKRAPSLQTICCWGTLDPKTKKLKHFDALAPMLEHADIWSIDKYLSLHYGWPFNICEKGDIYKSYMRYGVPRIWDEMHFIYESFSKYTGQKKPLEICEFNADGDVAGRRDQAALLTGFYRRVIKEKPKFLKGITYYQFRDRGRLGLEQEDPNLPGVGIASDFFEDYRRILHEERHFAPKETWTPLGPRRPRVMSHRASDDADGIGWRVKVPRDASFFEIKLPKELNLLVRVGKGWFYKRPGTEWVDATGAARAAGSRVEVVIFAPPGDGTNPSSGRGFKSSIDTRLKTPPGVRALGPW